MFRIWTPFSFWDMALKMQGSAMPLVFGRVLSFVGWGAIVAWIHLADNRFTLNIEVAPYEAAGAVLALLLVLRTNAGYERWWEARKMWGAIVNDTRSMAIAAVTYGPDDLAWRRRVVKRTIALAHVMRRSLRGQRVIPEVAALLGPEEAEAIAASDHMPSTVAAMIARDIRAGLDNFAFVQADLLRIRFLDEIGGCERILKTPLPLAYAIEVRRFIFLFLVTLPFVLLNQIEGYRGLWLVPLVMALVSYPLLAIDKIGHELQEPFQIYRLNHLPLDEICSTIERNLLALLDEPSAEADPSADGKVPDTLARQA